MASIFFYLFFSFLLRLLIYFFSFSAAAALTRALITLSPSWILGAQMSCMVSG